MPRLHTYLIEFQDVNKHSRSYVLECVETQMQAIVARLGRDEGVKRETVTAKPLDVLSFCELAAALNEDIP